MDSIAFYCYNDSQVFNDKFLNNSTADMEAFINLLKDKGYVFHTLDIYKKLKKNPDICIFFDIPKVNIKSLIDIKKTSSIVLLREGKHIIRNNFNKRRHKEFDNILTWKENLIDEKKYFFMNCSRYYKKTIINKNIDFSEKSLCTLINSNLYSTANNELYSLRFKIIKWFENNHLGEFDLYGYGWDTLNIYFFNKKIFKTKRFKKLRKSYKGVVNDKIITLNNYKFCICFENAIVHDYITEKIIDCFHAKVIPIYFGAPNIEEIVPSNCYVDFNRFKNLDEMYDFMKSFSEDNYKTYIKNIEKYLKSASYKKYFSIDSWVDSIYSAILRIS